MADFYGARIFRDLIFRGRVVGLLWPHAEASLPKERRGPPSRRRESSFRWMLYDQSISQQLWALEGAEWLRRLCALSVRSTPRRLSDHVILLRTWRGPTEVNGKNFRRIFNEFWQIKRKRSNSAWGGIFIFLNIEILNLYILKALFKYIKKIAEKGEGMFRQVKEFQNHFLTHSKDRFSKGICHLKPKNLCLFLRCFFIQNTLKSLFCPIRAKRTKDVAGGGLRFPL